MVKAIFEGLCPNCGGAISSERLLKGLPCEKCMPEEKESFCEIDLRGRLREYCEVIKKLNEWEEFFKERVGSSPWSLQRSWARKVFLKRSFALLAPTGVGKSTFGLITSLFLAKEGKRSYIILPTKILVQEFYKKLLKFGAKEEELAVAGELSQKKKEELKERIRSGDFKILISTSMFLYNNYSIIPNDLDFIFVDDVDSFLKTAKNIDKVLLLLGFSEEDIEKALRLISVKSKRNKTEEDWEEIKKLSEEVQKLQEKAKGVLIVSSATGNPRSNRIKLFKELLGFEVGRPTVFLRNVIDTFKESEDLLKDASELVKRLGKGGLVFVSSDYGKSYVDEVVKRLNEEGIRAKSYEDIKEFSEFEKGDIDVIVGISSYKNPIARGLDLPHVVRYAVFIGVPKIIVPLNLESALSHLLWALLSLRPEIAKKFKDKVQKIDRWIQSLRRYATISEEFIENTPELKEKIERLKKEITEFILSEEVQRLIEESEELTIRKEEDGYRLIVADVTGYLQASGRTSRMFAGGLTKGLSVILLDDRRAFNNLIKKIRWFNEDVKFIPFEEIDLEKIIEEIDRDRRRVREILKGEIPQSREIIKPVLIVVESPNKARTIANFFGKPVTRRFGEFEVLEVAVGDMYLMITSSLGHILDLTKEEKGFHGVFVNNGDFIPVYEIIEGKEKTVEGLKNIAQEVEEVLIATDPDTEGEKIGWDIGSILSTFVKSIRRIEFHEVTRKAIKEAVENPRDFDENLVKAQVLRRISDRWVGFEVSRILQKNFGMNWLSGGRVQVPVLGWIIEREKEYRKKKHVVQIDFKDKGKWFRVEFEFQSKKEAKEFYEKLKTVHVEVLEEFEEEINPPPPFTTDTLLKEISDRYRFGVSKTMNIAQELFEKGLITYHRTDSTRVSDTGMALAKRYISENFSEEFVRLRKWGEGGAHECIRPTKEIDWEEMRSVVYSGQIQDITKDHLLVYETIFRRFMASQMKPVKVKVKRIKIKALDREKEALIRTEIIEEGFNKIYPVELNPDISGEINVEDKKNLKSVPSAYLYTQGSLVQEMKRRGIGRPSTYATIVQKLLDRGYVIERNGFLIPTKLGKQVYEFLKNQEKILPFVSEEFTRRLESLMDAVEEGKEDYKNILKELYGDIIEFEASVRRVGA